ncbi:MAG: metal transporter [Acidobacteria bacterium]|nr:metal transporter [Acidobacteriota bacterium]
MKQWLRGLFPLVLLSLLLGLFFWKGPLGVFRAAFPPLEELTIERIELPALNQMVLHVVNGGADPVTVAQVMVDDALWEFSMEPSQKTIPRLGRARIRVPYPWVAGEAHEVMILTSTGLTFGKEIPVATQSPQTNWTYFTTFSLLGIYAGVIPVFLGLLWYPFLRDLSSSWLNFFLSLTVGLLFFLAVDTLEEAAETAGTIPDAFQGIALIMLGVLGTLLLLFYLSRSKSSRADKTSAEGRFWTALMIAVGIGLHNLGEGLAIGSAYSLGEIALGAFLVVGFTVHNLTEGLGIVAPIAKDRPSLGHLAALGAIAGVPTIFGTWIGGFSYSPILAVLFLSVGAGAIVQVIYEIVQLFVRKGERHLVSAHNLSGFLLGMAIMYATGLLVVA